MRSGNVLYALVLIFLLAFAWLARGEEIGYPKDYDPLIKCCDGTWHRLSEWKGKPLEYPSPAVDSRSMVVPFQAAGGHWSGYSGACRT